MAARGSTILLKIGLNACRQNEVSCGRTSQLRLCSRLHSSAAICRSSPSLHVINSPSFNTDPTVRSQHRHDGSPVHPQPHCYRCYSSGTLTNTSGRVSLFTKIKHAMGFKGKSEFRYPTMKMTSTGFKLYRNSSELIDYEEFFEVFDMPDTFNSWFLVMELHVWLCMVRLAGEGADGKYVRNRLIETMWKDVEERVKLIGKGASRSYMRNSLETLGDHFHLSLFAYDEGLLSDDRVLAGAIWRVFLEKRDPDPQALALMVKYIREQVHVLDGINSERLLCHGDVTFKPLSQEKTSIVQSKRDQIV